MHQETLARLFKIHVNLAALRINMERIPQSHVGS